MSLTDLLNRLGGYLDAAAGLPPDEIKSETLAFAGVLAALHVANVSPSEASAIAGAVAAILAAAVAIKAVVAAFSSSKAAPATK